MSINTRDPLKDLTDHIDFLIEEYEEVNSIAAKMTIALTIVDYINALHKNIFNGRHYIEYLDKKEQIRYKDLTSKYSQEYENLRSKDLESRMGRKIEEEIQITPPEAILDEVKDIKKEKIKWLRQKR